jgi:gamma-glutamyl-gamma-aminobutyrate hydrolase PuuD
MRARVGLSQRLEWLEPRGEMREALDVAWAERLSALGAQPFALPTRGSAPEAVLRDYGLQALILTGGNDSGDLAVDAASKERNARESGFLQAARLAGIPVLGVCHGMQLMNVHLGGRVSAIERHVRTPHRLEGAAASVLGLSHVNSFHDVGIRRGDVAAALAAVGAAEDASIEALVHAELDWMGVMWHPERAMPGGTDGMKLVAEFLNDPSALCRALRRGARA